MSNETAWKFASNTFRIITEENNPLAGEILRDHAPKLALATVIQPDFATVNGEGLSTFRRLEAV